MGGYHEEALREAGACQAPKTWQRRRRSVGAATAAANLTDGSNRANACRHPLAGIWAKRGRMDREVLLCASYSKAEAEQALDFKIKSMSFGRLRSSRSGGI